MSENIFAAFRDVTDAEKAAGALLDHGVRPEDIGIVLSEEYRIAHGTVDDPELQYTQQAIVTGPSGRTERPDPLGNELRGSGEVPVLGGEMGPKSEVPGLNRIEHEKHPGEGLGLSEHSGIPSYDPDRAAKSGMTTTTPHDAAVGAAKGLGYGVGLGTLAAIAAVTIPGFGLVLGGGALGMALASIAGSAGAGVITGGLVGYLKDQGVPEGEAGAFHECCDDGGAILGVTVRDDVAKDEIERIATKYGATRVGKFGYVA